MRETIRCYHRKQTANKKKTSATLIRTRGLIDMLSNGMMRGVRQRTPGEKVKEN